MADMTDNQLLREYADHGSDTAFATLVDRHLGLVHGIALRQLHDAHLAEDVAQAVFTLLARKARRLRVGVVLTGWLYRTTRFVASRASRTEQRRRWREQEALAMRQLDSTEPTASHLGPILDEALSRLGDKERDALLLRFAQDRSLRQVGEQLGLSEEAAKKRVARALDRLRGFFVSRGFTLTGASIATLLSEQLGLTAPSGLASVIVGNSLSDATAVSPALPVLVRETLSAWAWAKVRLAGAISLGAAVAVGITAMRSPEGPAVSSSAQEAPSSSVSSAQEGASHDITTQDPGITGQPGPRILLFRVLARDTGEMVPHGKLAINQVVGGEWSQRHDLVTDPYGVAAVPYSDETSRLDVGLVSSGWGVRSVRWDPFRDDPIPATYDLLVDRVTDTMGGRVLDPQGRPVAGAVVWGRVGSLEDASDREVPREALGFWLPAPLTQTDARGFWTAGVVPRGESIEFQLQVKHPDFAETTLVSGNTDPATQTALESLWAGQWFAKLVPTLALVGRVLDPNGQPVPGASVVHSPHSPEVIEVHTDAAGAFVIPGLGGGGFDFVVTANGFAPEYRRIGIRPGLEPVEVRLRPGASLRVRLVDSDGFPVPDATLFLEQWGRHRHKLNWSAVSGFDGLVEWNSAPPDDALDLVAFKDGWCYTREISLVADGAEHTIAMRRALELTGLVTDALTGLPVNELRAFPGYGTSLGTEHWERSATRRSEDGTYRVVFSEDRLPWRLRIEAGGYAPFVSAPITPDHPGWLDVSLQPTDQHGGIHGVVLHSDGSPVVHASVALLTSGATVELQGTRFTAPGQDRSVTTTQANGRFDFAPNPQAHAVVAVTTQGFARQAVRGDGQALNLQLQPWGRVHVTVAPALKDICRRASLIDAGSHAQPDGLEIGNLKDRIPYWREGQFRFLQVPPGAYVLEFSAELDEPPHHQALVTVEPGVTTTVHVETYDPELL